MNVHCHSKLSGKKKNIDFEADVEDRVDIYADEDLMELVWNNLISTPLSLQSRAAG